MTSRFCVLFFICFVLMDETFSRTPPAPLICEEVKTSLEKIISIIKEKQKTDLSYHLSLNLAEAYMVASVHKEYVICAPAYIRRDKDWGRFKGHRSGETWEYVHWDGQVRERQYLEKAESILKELISKRGSRHLYLKLYLGWVYEKQGKLKEAIAVHQFVIEKGIKLVEKNFTCKLEPCGQLMATLESLKFLKRIYKAQGKKEKIKEIDSLLQVNIKKVVGPNDFKGDFFRHMHKDDPEKLEQLDEFMKKHEVTK